MGVLIIRGFNEAALYCDQTDRAFGLVLHNDDDHDADQRMEMFLDWLKIDPTTMSEKALETKFREFICIEKELWENQEREQFESIDVATEDLSDA